jgi:hypothetical protein
LIWLLECIKPSTVTEDWAIAAIEKEIASTFASDLI